MDQAFDDCPNLKELIFLGDRPTFTGKAERGSIGAGPCFYPCTNPTWNSDIHSGHSTMWVPNHQCVNGVCVLCGAAEIYAYGSRGEAGDALWIVDVNYTATYYGDGANPSVGIPATTGNECQTFVKKVVFMPEIGYIGDYAFTRDWEKLSTLVFLGDAPEMYSKCFSNITVTAYYPADNPTWTKSVRQQYGGKITWVASCSGPHTFENSVCTACGCPDPDYIAPLVGVTRIFGADRYETAFKTAEVLKQQLGVEKFDSIVVACGDKFADALGGSYLAAKKNAPILLVKDSLNDSQKAFLQSHAANKKYILGGTAAVSAAVENQAKAYGTVERIGGNTRYETSVLIAKEFFPDATQAVLAYAQNFPDGLSGGALAYAMKAPLVLTASGKESVAASYAKEQGIGSGVILGGSGLISDKAVRTIFQMKSGDTIKIG